jgi:S-formylglutathione hydrolase
MHATSLAVCAVALFALGCAEQRSLGPGSTPLAASPCGALKGIATRAGVKSQAAQLCVHLASTGPLPARPATVVLAWFRPQEKARFANGLYPPTALLEAFLERARVIPEVTLGGQTELALDYPGGDAVVLAVVDFEHAFWPTMFGGGEGNFIGVSAPAAAGRAEVALAPTPSNGARPEGCAGERFELVRLDGPGGARRLCVFIPASYAAQPTRRYPVVFLLPGFASEDIAYLRGRQDVRPKVDELARSGGGEAIVVGVDTSTRFGSTYFTDTSADGRWDSFVPTMIAEIDRRYRTRAEARSRAVVGHSTGGFNAVSLALRHPDLFTVVGASAPDALDLEGWLTEGKVVRPKWLAWSRLEHAVGGMGQFVSYAAAWSDQAFPYDLDSGELRAVPWKQWLAHSPLRLLDDAAAVEQVRKVLGGRIFLIAGRHDDFDLFAPTERFAARLTELQIPHQFTVVDGGHDSQNVQAAVVFAIAAMK